MLYIILSIVALYIQHLTLPPPTVQRVEIPIKYIVYFQWVLLFNRSVSLTNQRISLLGEVSEEIYTIRRQGLWT